MGTNILLSTQYDFENPMVYAEDSASEGVYYTSSAEQIADNVVIPRFSALSKDTVTGTVSPITVTEPSGNPQKQGKNALYHKEEKYNYTCGITAGTSFSGTTTKYYMITEVSNHAGPYFSPSSYGPETLTASDLTDSSVTMTYTYDGELSIDLAATRVSIYVDTDPYPEYVKDTDYTAEITLAKNDDGKNVLATTITVISGSSLDTDLTAGTKVIKFGVDPWLSEKVYVEGVDYKVEYTPTADNKLKTTVTWLKDISSVVYIWYKQPNYAGQLYGIAIHDTAANDPRTIAVWTSGYFDKSRIPNYAPYYGATEGFSFK